MVETDYREKVSVRICIYIVGVARMSAMPSFFLEIGFTDVENALVK